MTQEHIRGASGRNFSSFLIGAFVGAGVAFMIAPTRGSDLRMILRRSISGTREGRTDGDARISDGESSQGQRKNEKSARASAGMKETVVSPAVGEKQGGRSPANPKAAASPEIESGIKDSQDSGNKVIGSGNPRGSGVERSSTGIPDPSTHPREYKEAMKKYDTPDGNP